MHPVLYLLSFTVQGKVESVLESPIFAALLLISSVGLWALALTAGGQAWVDYSHLFDESKLVHVTTVDFFLLSAFAPFWMYNDAQLRDWKPRCAMVLGRSGSKAHDLVVQLSLHEVSALCSQGQAGAAAVILLRGRPRYTQLLVRLAHATQGGDADQSSVSRSSVPPPATEGKVRGRGRERRAAPTE